MNTNRFHCSSNSRGPDRLRAAKCGRDKTGTLDHTSATALLELLDCNIMKEILSRRKAMIFDLDGTLVDSNELHVESWDRAFRHFDKTFTREQLRKQI